MEIEFIDHASEISFRFSRLKPSIMKGVSKRICFKFPEDSRVSHPAIWMEALQIQPWIGGECLQVVLRGSEFSREAKSLFESKNRRISEIDSEEFHGELISVNFTASFTVKEEKDAWVTRVITCVYLWRRSCTRGYFCRFLWKLILSVYHCKFFMSLICFSPITICNFTSWVLNKIQGWQKKKIEKFLSNNS